jgi:hypothetical protein
MKRKQSKSAPADQWLLDPKEWDFWHVKPEDLESLAADEPALWCPWARKHGEHRLDSLRGRLNNRGFCTDMEQLLRAGIVYARQEAVGCAKAQLLNLSPS